MEKRRVRANGKEIEYIYEVKRVKNINLRLRPNGGVYVSAPSGMSAARADAFVISKARWIEERLSRFDGVRRSLPDNCVLYLGEKLPFVCEPNGKRAGYVSGGVLHVAVRGKPESAEETNAAGAAAARKWLARRAAEVLPAVYAEAVGALNGAFGAPYALRLRAMRSRWGSCNSARRTVTLNVRLIHAPLECIRYVCMHELAHMVSMRHDAAFYRALSAAEPDWKRLRRYLDENISPLL